MDIIVKYLDGLTDGIKAAEFQLNDDWIHFYEEGNTERIVATVRADKVLSVTLAENNAPIRMP